jgi:hypothetical protein
LNEANSLAEPLSFVKGTSINTFFGRITALRGTRNPHVLRVHSGLCVPSQPT